MFTAFLALFRMCSSTIILFQKRVIFLDLTHQHEEGKYGSGLVSVKIMNPQENLFLPPRNHDNRHHRYCTILGRYRVHQFNCDKPESHGTR